MTMSTTVNPIAHLQQHRDLHTEDRHLAMMQTTQCNIAALADVRPIPSQDDDPMFPTPDSSPRYASNDGSGYAQFYTSPHHSPTPLQGMDQQPMQSLSPNGSYIGPASPCSDYYPNSSPYSPPYDNPSPRSIHDSIDCSPHSTTCSPTVLNMPVCTGPNHFTSAAGPVFMSDPITSICSTTNPLPPVTSMLHSASFPTEIENKCINSMPLIHSQEFYSSISHHQHNPVFVDHGIPSYPDSFSQPPSVMPPTSSTLCRVSSDNSILGPEGELPIKLVDRQFHHDPVVPGPDSISYYPPTPESPATRQNGYNCGLTGDGVPMSKPLGYSFLPSVSQHSVCVGNFYPPTKPVTKGQMRRRKPQKPAVQVDDSEIKDIPTSAQLWEFTLRVLKKPKYRYMVNWENQQEGLFRFHDAQAFAALWGKHRNRPHMTYDKVARALRYYYKRDILNQVGGRLTYKFSKRLGKLYTSEE